MSHLRSWKEESATDTAEDIMGDIIGDETFVVKAEFARGIGGCEAAFLGAMYDNRPMSDRL